MKRIISILLVAIFVLSACGQSSVATSQTTEAESVGEAVASSEDAAQPADVVEEAEEAEEPSVSGDQAFEITTKALAYRLEAETDYKAARFLYYAFSKYAEEDPEPILADLDESYRAYSAFLDIVDSTNGILSGTEYDFSNLNQKTLEELDSWRTSWKEPIEKLYSLFNDKRISETPPEIEIPSKQSEMASLIAAYQFEARNDYRATLALIPSMYSLVNTDSEETLKKAEDSHNAYMESLELSYQLDDSDESIRSLKELRESLKKPLDQMFVLGDMLMEE